MFNPFFHPLRQALLNYSPAAGPAPLIKSVQRGIITIPTDEYSQTVTISEVDLNSSIVTHLGQNFPTTYSSKNLTYLSFDDSTTLKATHYFTDSINPILTSFEVIEFYPSYIKSKQDIWEAILAGHTSEDFPISQIDLSKTLLLIRGINPDRDPLLTGLFMYHRLLDSTTIRTERSGSDGSIYIAFTVLEFN